MMKPRCRSFDPISGQPLSPWGCPYGSKCGFMHPDSPSWKDARISTSSLPARPDRNRPPLASSRDTGDDFRMSKSDHPRWNDSPTRDRRLASSPDRGYPERRKDSGSKDSASRVPRNSSWGGPETSTGRGEPSTSGRVDPSTFGWGGPAPSTSGWGDPTPSKAEWGTPSLTTSPTRIRRPSPPLSHPPPPPPSLPPMLPPPPPDAMPPRKPSIHAFESGGPPNRSTTPGKARIASTKPRDMRQAYMARVTHLSEAVLLRNEYTQVIRTLESRRKMLNSQKYSHISETSQSKLDGYAQEYEDKARELKSKLDDTLSKLVESEIWPEGPPSVEPASTYEVALQQLQDVQTRLQSLEDAAKSDMNRKPASSNDLEPPVEPKRRRHSPSGGRVDAGTLSRLEALETRFDDVTNETTQQAENLYQKVESRIEEKLEALRLSTTVSEDVETGAGEGPAEIREKVTNLAKEYEGFVEEMVDLVEKNRDLAVVMKKLSEENEALRVRNNQLEAAQAVLQSDIARLNNEMQAVLSAIRIMKTTPSPPAAASAAVDLEQMRAQVRSELIEDLNPVLRDLREQCESAVVSGREETLKNIVTKLGSTVEMVNVIYSYVETHMK